MIDGLGGLPGLLSVIGTALLRIFGPEIAAGATSVANAFVAMTPKG
jgi:hypothetical protein